MLALGDIAWGEAALSRAASILELGGPIVLILVLLSMFALTVVLLKVSQFAFRRVGRPVDLEPVFVSWEAGHRRRAIRMAGDSPGLTGMLVARAMTALGNQAPAALVREDIERLAVRELAALRSGLRGLEVISQIAPLLGLFGTVLGMIEAFRKLQDAGANVDPGTLAGGIWVALLTTAAGLVLAIPASVVLAWLESRVAREHRNIEDALGALFTGRPAEQGAERAEAPRPVSEEIMSAI